jgi:8-oxo-dGTP diphosphatase
MRYGEYRYCPYCRQTLQSFRDEERLQRLRCPACGWIYYRNPTVGVAVVLVEDGRLLLGERQDGGWCIPCGHVEWDEDIEQAAEREFAEETGLLVALDGVLAVHSNFHNPIQHTVGIWYRGIRRSGALRAGGDLLQVGFFSLQHLPALKFPTDRDVVANLLSE